MPGTRLPLTARRARKAGITGWVVLAAAIIGLLAAPSLRYLWIFVGFAGLGLVLRGVVLAAGAAREFYQPENAVPSHSADSPEPPAIDKSE